MHHSAADFASLAATWWAEWWNSPLTITLVFFAVIGGRTWWQSRQQNKAAQTQMVPPTPAEETARRHRLMADFAHDIIVVMDAHGQPSYVNGAATRVLGFSQEELRNRNIFGLLHPHHRPLLEQAVKAVLSNGKAEEFTCQMAKLGGGWASVDLAAHGLPASDWVVREVVLHGRDVSQRQMMLESIARSEQRFRDFAASSADWLWETDPAGRFTYISPGVQHVLGFAAEDLEGRGQLEVLFPAEEDPVRDLVLSRTERRQAYRELEFWTNAKDGKRVCLRLSGVPVLDAQQEFLGYRGAASNITASKIERDQVYRLATTDHLTGLLNSLRFKEELERAEALAQRHNTQGVVLFIDLDRFKEINDTHGHEAGDQILQGIADILRDNVRSTDVVARRGGDEFSIIMHNITMPHAIAKVQRMIEAVKAFGVEYHGTRLTVTMSVGMVQYPMQVPDGEAQPHNGKRAEQLIMSADLAMYKAKDMGRNRLFVEAADTTTENTGSVRAQLKWLERLRHCLEHEDFEMHYQAIVPSRPTTWPHPPGQPRPLAEALLRIYDEHGNVGSPMLYIDAAEHFGLIQQLDLAVVKRVFKTQIDLMREGLEVDISINLSCRTLGDPAVLPKLQELLRTYPVDPARIIFEVTETMALHDPAQMRDIEDIKDFINSLRSMGFRFALDDFGTGFTSFRYLKLLQVDVVKIDGEYIVNLAQDATDRLFVQQMVGLCQGLGITTIAEFVEDRSIMATLLELGVDAGQGWLFAKPQADLRGLIEAYRGKIMNDWAEAPPLISMANGTPLPPAIKLKKPAARGGKSPGKA
jgi:diguanylate cyclase (GGDEF)-like protein/PAS domain S-box-containing protein